MPPKPLLLNCHMIVGDHSRYITNLFKKTTEIKKNEFVNLTGKQFFPHFVFRSLIPLHCKLRVVKIISDVYCFSYDIFELFYFAEVINPCNILFFLYRKTINSKV